MNYLLKRTQFNGANNYYYYLILFIGPSLGLHLNITKCELISSVMPVQSQSLNEFIAVSPPDASLLGAPLFPGLYKMLH